MSESEMVRRIRELAELRAAGILTDEEFGRAKAELLAGGTAQPVANQWSSSSFAAAGRGATSASRGLAELRARAERHGLGPGRLVSGDWAGAATAGLGALGATVGFVGACLVLILSVAGSELPVGTGGLSLTVVAMTAALALGGNVTISVGGFDAGVASTLTPLGATLVAFGVLAAVFLRRLAAVRTAAEAVLQGIRTWIVFLGGAFLLALAGRGSTPLFGSFEVRVATGIASTLFWAAVGAATTLTFVTAWRRPDLLPARWRARRDAVSGAVAGAVVTLLLLGGLVAVGLLVLVVYVGGEEDGSAAVVVLVAALLLGPNVAGAVLAVAVGVPGAANVAGVVFGGQEPVSVGLLQLVELDGRFWLLPVVAAALLVAGGTVATLHAPSPQEGRRASWRFAVVLALVLVGIAIATEISVRADGFGESLAQSFGLSGPAALLLGLLWGAAAGWMGAVLAPSLPAGMQAAMRWRIERARLSCPAAQPAVPGSSGGAGPSGAAPGPQPGWSVAPAAPPVGAPPPGWLMASPPPPPAAPPAVTSSWWTAASAPSPPAAVGPALPATGPSPTVGGTAEDSALVGRLQDLVTLHAAGRITDAGFAAAKAALLGLR